MVQLCSQPAAKCHFRIHRFIEIENVQAETERWSSDVIPYFDIYCIYSYLKRTTLKFQLFFTTAFSIYIYSQLQLSFLFICKAPSSCWLRLSYKLHQNSVHSLVATQAPERWKSSLTSSLFQVQSNACLPACQPPFYETGEII